MTCCAVHTPSCGRWWSTQSQPLLVWQFSLFLFLALVTQTKDKDAPPKTCVSKPALGSTREKSRRKKKMRTARKKKRRKNSAGRKCHINYRQKEELQKTACSLKILSTKCHPQPLKVSNAFVSHFSSDMKRGTTDRGGQRKPGCEGDPPVSFRNSSAVMLTRGSCYLVLIFKIVILPSLYWQR